MSIAPLHPQMTGWPELAALLARLVQEEELAEFDRHWVEILARLEPDSSPTLLLTAGLVRHAVDQGHVCLRLAEVAHHWPAAASEAGYPPPKPAELAAELARWSLVEVLEQAAPEPVAPLVLAGPGLPESCDQLRLYLRRYWEYEQSLAGEINRRAVPVPAPPEPVRAAERLAELTATAGFDLDREQRAAVMAPLNHYLTVISGGPGTGKTTIVFFILSLLRELASSAETSTAAAENEPLNCQLTGSGERLCRPDGDAGSTRPAAFGGRVLLLAPTGKAAARLAETLRPRVGAGAGAGAGARDCTAMTIHRALGYQSESPTIFRHNRENPLAADLVVVDEASMVDMALMSKLFAAVPTQARLVLLGDKDQLSSVEAGSILGDICQAAPQLSSSVIELGRGFRFDPQRGIGALVRGIKAGEPEMALAPLLACRQGQGVEVANQPTPSAAVDQPRPPSIQGEPTPAADRAAEVTLHDQAEGVDNHALQELILDGFRPCLEASDPAEALACLNGFRLLVAHRRGPYGVEYLNRWCRQRLQVAGLLDAADGESYYRGQPVLVVANSYETRLFNGDLGIIWPSPEDDGQLMAFFPVAQGPPRRLPPGRLPNHETAFAMTIHKSQGSEFDQVAILLPGADSPLLSRELLYTAVSRARRQVHLFATPEVIRRAINRRITRTSGLAEALGMLEDSSA